jgi:hypothetical protein
MLCEPVGTLSTLQMQAVEITPKVSTTVVGTAISMNKAESKKVVLGLVRLSPLHFELGQWRDKLLDCRMRSTLST